MPIRIGVFLWSNSHYFSNIFNSKIKRDGKEMAVFDSITTND